MAKDLTLMSLINVVSQISVSVKMFGIKIISIVGEFLIKINKRTSTFIGNVRVSIYFPPLISKIISKLVRRTANEMS